MNTLQTSEIIMILGMALVTLGVRYVPLLIVGRIEMPQRMFRALRFVPVAVLTAISVPPVFMPQGQLDIAPDNAFLVGGIVAVLIAWRSGSLLPTIIGGMGSFLLWRALTGGM